MKFFTREEDTRGDRERMKLDGNQLILVILLGTERQRKWILNPTLSRVNMKHPAPTHTHAYSIFFVPEWRNNHVEQGLFCLFRETS